MLAAFASEQMSLRRHVDTIVKPWLAANCGWIFQDRRLLLGVVEEMETDADCDFAQALQNSLGGSWDPASHPWESRRDSMLDVFGKVQGYTMKPALQIDRTNARLLVEALSGRWSYEQDRRDKRTVWHSWRMRFLSVSIALTRAHRHRARRSERSMDLSMCGRRYGAAGIRGGCGEPFARPSCYFPKPLVSLIAGSV